MLHCQYTRQNSLVLHVNKIKTNLLFIAIALSRRERRDLEWSEMLEHKVTMLSHNIHFFPPFKTNEEDPETGEGVMEWEDNIRETVGWVSSINKIEHFSIVNEIKRGLLKMYS